MMKRTIERILCMVACVAVFAAPGFADEPSKTQLDQRLQAVESRLNESILPQGWAKMVTLTGALEVESFFTDKNDDWEDEDGSDVELATADLGIDVQLAPWVSGHMLLSWDCEDDNSVGIDEAEIRLGGTEEIPAYLAVGRLYVPFGSFETNMISDPLTLEIGEVREGAIQAGVETAGFYAAVYGFNAEVDAVDEEDEIASFGASAGYAFENETVSVDLGGGYISNLLSAGMGELAEGDLTDEVGGFSGYLIANIGPFGLIGEYVTAVEEIENTEGWVIDEPGAWNAELGFTFEAAQKEITLAAAYQGTEECVGFLPETRLMGGVGLALTDSVGLSAQYAYDEDYDVADGGTGEDKNTVTFQIALEF